MAAKKRTRTGARVSEETAPPQPPEQSLPTDVGPVENAPERPGPPVAGIGASAGGLDAFKKFLTAMPPNSGIAFVLIPHLDPTHESLMVELLERCTPMPVVEAAEGMAAEANHIYIIPPNKYLTIAGGALRLSGPVERSGLQTSIDLFLRALADDKQEKAICIILSGTGAHGTLGLKAVKAAGGLAMVQDPNTADYSGMPQSAVATGLADYVLPVEQMPEVLIEYLRHPYVKGGKTGAAATEPADQLHEVLALLRARMKFDFRCYRTHMLTRRIERRMSLNHFDRLADYLAILREHPDEVKRLFRDLLISVTSFFRDPEAYQALEAEVIDPLIRARGPDEPLRVWSAGCATGEEPYSLGILLLEHLTAAQKRCPVQIFATDADEDALEVARLGIYPESIATDVSPERLGRFFTRVENASYRVSKPLRELVIVARQNLIADAPFSRLDLIVCRNLLLYLEPEVQKKVLALLHFALNEGGLPLFRPVGNDWPRDRIVRAGLEEMAYLPPHRPRTARAHRGPDRCRGRPARAGTALDRAEHPRPVSFADLTQRLLLEQFAPAAVLIDRKCEILYVFGPTDRYLAVPAGEPTQDLLLLAREGLRTKLRAAIHKAVRVSGPITLADAQVKRDGNYYPVTVTVRPIQEPQGAEGLLLVTFQEPEHDLVPLRPPETAAEETVVRQLEDELKTTREDLQSTIAEQETANEELKAANEEVRSMNEELQSANEELETSKEELQSLNEELNTVNTQLQNKVTELETANNDLANLLDCSEVAILFLDNQFRVKRFTPPATRLFNLLATDLNRPVTDLTPRFADSTLPQDLEQVLRTATPHEKQVQTADGSWWNRRITLYRTLENRIEGVILTFTDVTTVRLADEQARRLAAVLLDSNDAVSVHDFEGKITAWNRGAEQMFGYSEAEALQLNAEQLIPEEARAETQRHWWQLERGERVTSWETQRTTRDGRILDVWVTATALKDALGRPVAIAKTERDITEQKRAHAHLEYEIQQRTAALRKSQEQLAAILHTAADAIITIDAQGSIQSVNAATERMFGHSAAEMIGQNVNKLMPSPHREEHDRYLEDYLRTGKRKMIGIGREVWGRRKDGSLFPADLAVSEVDHRKLFTGILRDITRRKKLEREVLEIASLEQQRIGQNLHDSVGQELTALNILADDLAETLPTDPAGAAKLVEQLAQGLRRSQQELRAVMQGLFPVAVDTEGLMAALSDLADRTQQEEKVYCRFDCPEPVAVADNLVATHLYLIAQEAVHNALKHAQAENIRIVLEANDFLRLSVQDDGIGMPAQPSSPSLSAPRGEGQGGLGLRVMRNRAAIIGATLTIQPAEPSGTLVRCALPRTHHETKTDDKTSQILIVDDHPPVRDALASRIGRQPDLEVCGEAADMVEALRLVSETQPDLAVVDITLKDGNGLDLIKRIKDRNDRVRMLVWSMHSESLYAERVLRAGALGYVNKDQATDKIMEAIRRVLDGKVYLSDAMAEKLLHRAVGGDQKELTRSPLDVLADRELEVFRLIGAGVKTAEIAERLHLSVKTVETYRDRIRHKLDLSHGTELAHYATQWVLENQ